MAYIYIAWDITKPNMAKIGMTEASDIQTRISQTENPDYELFKSYKVTDGAASTIEANIHNRLAQ